MANFLDLTTGMPALWAKIKSKFYTKAEVDALIPEVDNSDWNENDTTSAAYIENRTHYTEDPVLTEIFAFQSDESSTYYEYNLTNDESTVLLTALADGAAYSIVFNGVTYSGQLAYDGNGGDDDLYLFAGNYSIWDNNKPDTGEPFVISLSSTFVEITSAEELANLNLSVSLYVSNVHKLDSKYLNGSLITPGFGKYSEIFNWLGRYTYDSYILNISGTAGATEYSYTSYDVPPYWGRINDFSFLTIESYEDYSIDAITVNDGGGQITFSKTLDENNEINNLEIHILEPSKCAVGYFSHAEGYKTKTFDYASHAEGYETIASGYASHAEGEYTTASGSYSHAEGSETNASGNWSHAEGYVTYASGDWSHAEGKYTTASGNYSHAEGYDTIASGNYAHAEGNSTIASRVSQHVYGSYNIQDTTAPNTINSIGKYIEIVGNGTSDAARSNAYTLDWSGNGWYSGKVSAGTVASPANPTAANDLATKAYVDAATAGVSPNLSGLADTNISNPANGQVLQYDATSSKWVNTTFSAGVTETRVNELIAAALAQYGDGDTATYGYNDASEVNY